MQKLLNNSVAVITGAGKLNSIGAATATLLASHGCNILINCLTNEQSAKNVATICKDFDVDAHVFVGDITNPEICYNMAQYVYNNLGKANILINCAGYTKNASYKNLNNLNVDDFNKIYSINAIAPYFMANAFQPQLEDSNNATIINVSSTAGITGKGSSIAYAASKGALNTLTIALAQALSPSIRVNAICPNFVNSSWWDDFALNNKDKYESLIQQMENKTALKKVLQPKDVAQTILNTILNPLITGEIIRLDAGTHLNI